MNNKKNAARVARFFAFLWLLTLTLLVVSFLIELGIDQAGQIGLVAFLLFLAGIFYAGGFFFIELETDATAFRIKHYNLFPIGQKFLVYQIPLERFKTFKIQKHAGGLFTWLYLFEQTNRGLAKYPSIGLSALSSGQLKTLAEYLKGIQKS